LINECQFIDSRPPRILILSASPYEQQYLKADMTITSTKVVNNRNVYIGELYGKQVALASGSYGSINAAVMAQSIIEIFNIEGIVFVGTAAAMKPGVRVGDVLVPALLLNYEERQAASYVGNDVEVYSTPAEDYYTYVNDPYFKTANFGMMFPYYIYLPDYDLGVEKTQKKYWLDVDPDYLAVMQTAVQGLVLPNCGTSKCAPYQPEVTVGGKGVSGLTLLTNALYHDYIWDKFQPDCLDKESAQIAWLAFVNQKPFIAIRSPTDGGGYPQPSISGLAYKTSNEVAKAFLQALP
jgi:adenosylhomocysteine nucleosidase